jgi:hypothetical protein
MLADIERRFRSRGIDGSDCAELKSIILSSDNESALESAIFIFGRSCPFDVDVLEVCKKYFLEQPVPGLTAVCMRTALDFWGLWKQYPGVLSGYLKVELYGEWYDEVLFASAFCKRLDTERATTAFKHPLRDLFEAAERLGISELVEAGRH